MAGLTSGGSITAADDALPPDMLSWLAVHEFARSRATLVLWDISSLLVPCAELDIAAHRAAFTAITGRPPDAQPQLDVGTDPQIALDLLMTSGTPRGRAVRMLPRLLPELIRHAQHWLATSAITVPTPRTRILLDQIAAADGTLQSVITRNMRGIAERKLGVAGLVDLLSTDIGGYGSDCTRLDQLVTIARTRAALRHQVLINPADVVVVSNSPVTAAMAQRAGAHVAASPGSLDDQLQLGQAAEPRDGKVERAPGRHWDKFGQPPRRFTSVYGLTEAFDE
jgi:phosphoglycolate phosphatase